MRIAIVGAGAIGCLFGAKLTLAGNDVTLIHRDSSVVRALQRQGVILRELTGKPRVIHVPTRKGPVRVRNLDAFIVTVKAYDTISVANSYRGKIDTNAIILSLQNGLDNLEVLRKYLKRPTLGGSTTEGALSTDLGSVMHTGKGSTIIGSSRSDMSEFSSDIKKTFNEAGFRTTIDSNIGGVLWTKTIVNAAINPLTALTGMSNGALSKNSAMIEIGTKAVLEGMNVSRAERVQLVGDPRKLWRKILTSTRANKSSMLQDIERGKRTEIRQLNGAIVSRAKKVGVKVPFNEMLTKLVLGLELSVIRRELDA